MGFNRMKMALAAGCFAVASGSARAANCVADLTLDCSVTTADLVVLLSVFGTAVNPPGQGADFTADGKVDTSDLVVLVNRFGQTCCEDGLSCTADTCVNGVCSKINLCDDNNACTIDTCNPGNFCTFLPVNCNDNNPCTIDSCHPEFGCVNTPRNCDDNNPCTLDTCDPLTGNCINTPIEGPPCD